MELSLFYFLELGLKKDFLSIIDFRDYSFFGSMKYKTVYSLNYIWVLQAINEAGLLGMQNYGYLSAHISFFYQVTF